MAAGHVDVEFVPGPGLFVALAVFLAADVAGGGQVGEHPAEALRELPLETRRLRLRRLFVLAWMSALARRRGIVGRRGIVFAVIGLFWTGFSRASISVASPAIAPMMRPPSARSISAACMLSGSAPRANSANARENVASEGTCEPRSQPRMRRRALSTSRRSIRALAAGTPRTALATKARARARRSSGGRPGPLGGSGTKASRPITSSVVTRRPNASVIGSLSSRIQGRKSRDVAPASLHRVERVVCHVYSKG